MYTFWNLTPQVQFQVFLQLPTTVECLGEPGFKVVVVLDSKIVLNKLYYLVDWLAYTPID